MLLRQLFEPKTCTFTYLLADKTTGEAVLIDPVHSELQNYLAVLQELELQLLFVLDTHIHADHVTAAGELRSATGARTVVSENAGVDCADLLATNGTTISFGTHHLIARKTPGPTSSCLTFIAGDQSVAFTGDALLINGCGRTDFQGGDSKTLYESIHREIFSLPDSTRLYPGHDYNGKTSTTVGQEKNNNVRLGNQRSIDSFIALMDELNLPYPNQIHQALPLNQACGQPTNSNPPRKTS